MIFRKSYKGIGAVLLGILLLIAAVLPAGAMEAGEVLKDEKQILSWAMKEQGVSSFLSEKALGDSAESVLWFVFDAARMGERGDRSQCLGALKKQVEVLYQTPEETFRKYAPTDWYKLVLVIAALGGEPSDFGKDPDGNRIDLMADASWSPRFRMDQVMSNQIIWELIALDAMDYKLPEDGGVSREELVAELYGWQNEDGGFGLLKDGASDTDLTAMALTALAPYGANENTDRAFAYLSGKQNGKGEMMTISGNEESATSETTAWTLLALSVWGKDAETEEAFIKNGNTLYDGLKSFRGEDGSCCHTLEDAPNKMAAYQSLYGLEAFRRMKAGEESIFDLTKVEKVSDTKKESKIPVIFGICGGVILVLLILAVLAKKKAGGAKPEEKKPEKKQEKKHDKKSDREDWDDEEW